jgi:hypothetical protein
LAYRRRALRTLSAIGINRGAQLCFEIIQVPKLAGAFLTGPHMRAHQLPFGIGHRVIYVRFQLLIGEMVVRWPGRIRRKAVYRAPHSRSDIVGLRNSLPAICTMGNVIVYAQQHLGRTAPLPVVADLIVRKMV